MADIKTRDAVKGTIKTLDKGGGCVRANEKSAYAKTKEKAEEGYFSEESSPSEYAGNRLSFSAERVTKKASISLQEGKVSGRAKESIIKAKDKIADFRQRRAEKAMSAAGRRTGALWYAIPFPCRPDGESGAAGKQHGQGTARKANKTVKTAAKGTVKTTQKNCKNSAGDFKSGNQDLGAGGKGFAGSGTGVRQDRTAGSAGGTDDRKGYCGCYKSRNPGDYGCGQSDYRRHESPDSAIAAGGWAAVWSLSLSA